MRRPGIDTKDQVGLFNWAAGGQSNMTLIGNLNLFANRKWETGSWDNALDMAYGSPSAIPTVPLPLLSPISSMEHNDDKMFNSYKLNIASNGSTTFRFDLIFIN